MLAEMATGETTKNEPKQSSECCFTKKQAPKILPNAESRDARIRICEAAFREQMGALIAVSMTTYFEVNMLDMDQ
jgi:hypothetical protein